MTQRRVDRARRLGYRRVFVPGQTSRRDKERRWTRIIRRQMGLADHSNAVYFERYFSLRMSYEPGSRCAGKMLRSLSGSDDGCLIAHYLKT